MRKTVISALLFSVFGTGAALAKCEYAYPGCINCPPGANNYRATKIFLGFGCHLCAVHRCSTTSSQCQENGGIFYVSEEDKMVEEKVDAVLRDLGPEVMKISTDRKILFEIVEKNPYAAIGLHGIYEGSATIPVKSTIWAKGDPDGIFDSRKVKELLMKFYNNEYPGDYEYELKENDEKTRIDHELRKTSDGAAYMNIEISTADANYKEKGKILPNVRVHLRWEKDGDNGHWEPIGWETY